MELKYRSQQKTLCKIGSFNRTFMELKSEYYKSIKHREVVLIVPLWN